VSAARCPGQILVIAGTNGAGKSTVAGAAMRTLGTEYFNPDEATRRILEENPDVPPARANSIAWHDNLARLQAAIAAGTNYAFETTLGGSTITRNLLAAARSGTRVRMFYVGLASVDLHIERVRQRVARGGHDIPQYRIRARYDHGRKNLIRLLPWLVELALLDNSIEADPHDDDPPRPRKLLHLDPGSLRFTVPPREVPGWARPIFGAALRALGS